jgi:hypothetical protein
MLVAVESFTDPTDGVRVEAGRTFVHETADVARLHPERFKPVQGKSNAPITRLHDGATAKLAGAGSPPTGRRPRRPVSRRPSWQLGPTPHSYRDVEVLERGESGFVVDLSTYTKNFILDTIRHAHRQAGEAVEVAGWLWTPSKRPGQNDWLTIAHATVDAVGTPTSVFLSDPHEARTQLPLDLDHMTLAGDWHTHASKGSTLPSETDARAWAGTADALARDCYVSLIVSPSSPMGWTFTRWIAYRRGTPSRPYVARAALSGEGVSSG